MEPRAEDGRELADAWFDKTELTEVLTALDAYGAQSHEREVQRVRCAILQLSEGSLEKLHYWLGIAKADYRDVLAALQLGPSGPDEGRRLQAEARGLIDRWGKH